MKQHLRTKAGRLAAYSLFLAWVASCQQREALASGVVAPSAAVAAKTPAGRSEIRIPAGPLAGALEAFTAATGLAVDLDVPAETLAAIDSPGCSGALAKSEALAAILDGTGLAGTIEGARAVVRFEYAESVDVAGEAPTTLSQTLPKYQGSLRETPQSIDVVSAEILEQQATTTLGDALRNVPGISLAAGEGGFQGDGLTIRGFNARGDLHLDGMRDFGSYFRDPFALEEVQVLKGPSGMSFGRGSTGGVVNQATKLPRLDRFGAAELELGTNDSQRLTLDIAEPLEKLGRGTAFRVAAVAHESGVAGRDVTESTRLGIAPSLAFGLGTSTRYTLSHMHQDADDIPDYGVPWFFHEPAKVPRGSYYGFREGSYLETDVDVSTFRFEHDFGPKISLRNQARYANSTRRARITQGIIDPVPTDPDTPLDNLEVRRNQVDAASEETLLQNQFDVMLRLESGRVTHSLVTGLEATRETSSPVRTRWDGVPRTSLMDPQPGDAFAGTPTITSDVEVDTNTLSAYVVDTMQVTEKLSFVAGLRHDRFDADHENAVPTPAKFHRVDTATTWRAGVVFEPRPNGSLYASAATSFNPSAEQLSLSASTEHTDPEENRSLEIGTKWDLADNNVHLRGAIFQTDKTAARETDPQNPSQQVLSGEQRVRGFEVEVDGRITPRWNLTAGYCWLDSEVMASKLDPSPVGEPVANVPEHTFTTWSLHALPFKLELGWGVRHVSGRTTSSTSPRDPITKELKELPSYWTADAMLSRELSRGWSMQLNVANLTDELYFDKGHNNHVIPGAGRSATLGVKFEWPR